jgi:hypothetical protein
VHFCEQRSREGCGDTIYIPAGATLNGGTAQTNGIRAFRAASRTHARIRTPTSLRTHNLSRHTMTVRL